MNHEYLNIDLKLHIEKLKEFKLLDIYKFNGFISDLANYIYDTYDQLEDLNVEGHSESKIIIERLKVLQPQIKELNIILNKLYQYFDEKYMHRLVNTSFPLEEMIDKKLDALN